AGARRAGAAARQSHTVGVAGCVEGELPSVRSDVRFFDRALLAGPDVPSIAERRRRSLDEERRLFRGIASTRATGRLIATAAPEPGVLLSRFVEELPTRAVELPLAVGPEPVVRAPTASDVPVYPD